MTRVLPKEALWISESGISSPTTVSALREAGYRGFLIGENFMKTVDPGASLGKFLNKLKKDF
jgi:indole-3-glycerol phosphate synthase